MFERVETAVEASFLLAASWPFWRFLIFSPLTTRMTTKIAAAAALLAIYAAVVVAAAIYSPAVLRTLAAIVLMAFLGLLWWSRTGLRTGRLTPPGRFTILPLAPCMHRKFYLQQASQYGPVFRTGSSLPCPSLRPTVNIVSHKVGLDVLRDHDDALQVWPLAPFSLHIPRGALRYMNPADHKVHSHLFRNAMTAELSGELGDFFVQESRDTLSKMAEESALDSSIGIQPKPYIDEMLFTVFSQVLFGISDGSDSFDRLQEMYRDINIPKLSWPSRREGVQRSVDTLIAFLSERGRQLTEGTNLESSRSNCVLAEIIRIDPDRVDDRTMLGNLVYMLDAGRTDVGALLRWILKYLVDNPHWLAELRTRPDSNNLADRIVGETLRLEQSEYLYRRVLRDVEVRGYVVPKGWLLRVCIREGHKDSETFGNPDSFNPDRFIRKKYSHTQYAPFGLFRHTCIGAQLTHAIGRAFVTELATRFDCHVVDDGPPVHGRFHWQPSEQFRVRIKNRGQR